MKSIDNYAKKEIKEKGVLKFYEVIRDFARLSEELSDYAMLPSHDNDDELLQAIAAAELDLSVIKLFFSFPEDEIIKAEFAKI